MKGVAERSSVFASEIFTTISPIPFQIHIKKNASKRIGYIELNSLLFFLNTKITLNNTTITTLVKNLVTTTKWKISKRIKLFPTTSLMIIKTWSKQNQQ